MCGQNPDKFYLTTIGMRLASTKGCDDGKLGELNSSNPWTQGNLPWHMKCPDTLHELHGRVATLAQEKDNRCGRANGL